MVYLLDARTKDGNKRVTSFAEDNIEELFVDFMNWVHDEEITKDDLWFGRVFAAKGPRHVGNVGLDEDGNLTRELAPPNSPLTLKDSKYTLRVRIKYLLHRL